MMKKKLLALSLGMLLCGMMPTAADPSAISLSGRPGNNQKDSHRFSRQNGSSGFLLSQVPFTEPFFPW